MLKNIFSFFLVLLFFTQTVFAGVDVHIKQQARYSIDILQHYVDDHSKDYNSKDHNCNLAYGSDITEPDKAALDNVDGDGNSINVADANHNHHHHCCHGHITSFMFYNNAFTDITYSPSSEHFSYLFSFHSITQSPSFRPPIAS